MPRPLHGALYMPRGRLTERQGLELEMVLVTGERRVVSFRVPLETPPPPENGRTLPSGLRRYVPTTVLSGAHVPELEPAVTWGLWASKAPSTSSFSRAGTLKWSSASASRAET